MSFAQVSREQTSSEPVSNRTEKSRLPIATASSRPFMLNDASAPVLTLSTDPSSSPFAFPPLQTKLTINQPGDQHEQEADRVAEQVMRMPDPDIRLQRKCSCDASSSGPCEQCGAPLIQRRATAVDTSSSAAAPAIVHDTLHSSGQALDLSTRAFFEARFKQDFGHVRVHTDKQAATSAEQISARAYTVGRDIVFGSGEYSPRTMMGQQLLAHELAHVVQQSKGRIPATIQRAETDTGAPHINCPTLADGAATLNTEVNRRLTAARAALARPIVPADMVFGAFQRLGSAANPFLALIENWANTNLPHRGGGTGFSTIRGTKFQNIPLAERPLYTYLAPVVKLNGICLGTDKIGHMFQQGFQYFIIAHPPSRTSAGGALGAGRGETYARAWGEWMEGVLSPATRSNAALMRWLRTMSSARSVPAGITGHRQGYFGLATTGVHSRADLESNNAGLRFYQELFRDPLMTFDISRYVSANWNEEGVGNIYSNVIGTAVTSAGRLNPMDVVLPP